MSWAHGLALIEVAELAAAASKCGCDDDRQAELMLEKPSKISPQPNLTICLFSKVPSTFLVEFW